MTQPLPSAVARVLPAATLSRGICPLAAVGLLVNLLSAFLLRDSHGHGDNELLQHNDHDHHHSDHNLRAAYIHVVADAAVSVLVLIGLIAGRVLGWVWLDPMMGIVGMLVIANWSWNLIHASGAVLLDMRTADGIVSEIARRLETGRDDRYPTSTFGASAPVIAPRSCRWFRTSRNRPRATNLGSSGYLG
jgi:cation diffusion facilitator family transporter